MPFSDSDPRELNRRAAAVNEILGRIGLSSRDATEWWNFSAYEELGGRTATQAWLAGDHHAVERLVLSWYERSETAARRARGDEAFLRMLSERRRAIAAESPGRRTA
ncbi:MAG: hypothetical protein M0Z95_13645 [Actinomycetota bacterium]|nr:hypothetical protein [Actinomycetota bacterium]